jgi:hypothetical protein
MSFRAWIALLAAAAALASPVSADYPQRRPLPPPPPADLDGRNVGPDNWPGDIYEPPVVMLHDPKAEAERAAQEERDREAQRQRTLRSHNDPFGGFFPDRDQDPKNMFPPGQ